MSRFRPESRRRLCGSEPSQVAAQHPAETLVTLNKHWTCKHSWLVECIFWLQFTGMIFLDRETYTT